MGIIGPIMPDVLFKIAVYYAKNDKTKEKEYIDEIWTMYKNRGDKTVRDIGKEFIKKYDNAKPQKEKKKEVIYTSMLTVDGLLYEQIYDNKTQKSCFINEKGETVDDFLLGDFVYAPMDKIFLEKNVVVLPSGISDYDTVETLDKEISDFISYWVGVSDDFRQKCVWYTRLTRLLENINTTPYLRVLGSPGSGKTRFLDTVGGLCYKPLFIGGAVKSAPIYRIMDSWKGSAIFDEMTLKISDESADIIQILNCGYQKGKSVLRCEKDSLKVIPFDPFGPKIIAQRKTFYDTALESRCISEVMSIEEDKPIDLNNEFYNKRDELQNKLLKYRFDTYNKVDNSIYTKINFGSVIPRVRQSFAPFAILFTECPDILVNYVMKQNEEVISKNAESFEGILINAYAETRDKFDEDQNGPKMFSDCNITASDLKESLVKKGWNKDKISPITISKTLHNLGFKTEMKRLPKGKPIRRLIIEDRKWNMLKSMYMRYDSIGCYDSYGQCVNDEKSENDTEGQ